MSALRPTVVLVHGAFADASSWNKVIARLQGAGYPVIAPANPLRDLAGDSAYLSSVVSSIGGPVILVGHSYGGAVIANAATGRHLQQRYLADLQASVRDTVSRLDPAPFFAKYGSAGNAWAIFAGYLNAVAQQAAAPVVDRYLGTLAAADVFTEDNAFGLLESLRIDTGLLGPFGIHP